MITFLYGDDALSISNFINGRIQKYNNGDIYRFEKKDIRAKDILEIVNSGGLFSTKKLILVDVFSVNNIKFTEEELMGLVEDSLQEIIINASKLSQTAKTLKLFQQAKARVVKYAKKPDYSNFDIADALIILNNPKRAILLFNAIKDVESIINGLLATIAYDLRGVLSVRSNNKLSKTFKPFVRNKFLKSTLTDDEVKVLYKKLFDLEAECKNYKRKISTRDLFIDFILENFLK